MFELWEMSLLLHDDSYMTGGDSIDGVVVNDGDRVLIVGQSNVVDNGVYIVSSDPPVRATDMLTGTRTSGV